MFNSTIDINDNYFYMPFGPVILDPKEVGLKRTPFTDTYVDIVDVLSAYPPNIKVFNNWSR